MQPLTALRLLACLCALLSLTACGLLPQRPTVTRTVTVEVPLIAYRPLPRELTTPLPAPLPPSRNCVDAAGASAVCVLDALATIPRYQAVIGLCNADRARAALLGATDGAQ